MGFFERLNDGNDAMNAEIDAFRTALLSESTTSEERSDRFLRLGSRLVSSEEHILKDAAKLPAVRTSTKREICRRALRGRDLLLSTFDQRLTLKEIASEACMSPYHFHRSFRQLFGMTPHALVTAYRLQRAARRLKTTLDSVTEISYESGFESLPSFSALFRRHFGKSPSCFRRLG
jgi:AraC-like DNA-binding protein